MVQKINSKGYVIEKSNDCHKAIQLTKNTDYLAKNIRMYLKMSFHEEERIDISCYANGCIRIFARNDHEELNSPFNRKRIMENAAEHGHFIYRKS